MLGLAPYNWDTLTKVEKLFSRGAFITQTASPAFRNLTQHSQKIDYGRLAPDYAHERLKTGLTDFPVRRRFYRKWCWHRIKRDRHHLAHCTRSGQNLAIPARQASRLQMSTFSIISTRRSCLNHAFTVRLAVWTTGPLPPTPIL